jgi:hypothetical protein
MGRTLNVQSLRPLHAVAKETHCRFENLIFNVEIFASEWPTFRVEIWCNAQLGECSDAVAISALKLFRHKCRSAPETSEERIE